MRALLLCLALGLSGAVSAQTTTTGLLLDFNGQKARTVSSGDCGSQVTLNWTGTPLGQVCSDIQIWITSSTSCADAPATGDLQISNSSLAMGIWPTQRSGTVQIPISSLPIFTVAGTDGGTANACGAAIQQALLVCGSYKYTSGIGFGCSSSSSVVKATPPTLRYDAQAPSAPVLGDLVPLDGALQVPITSVDSDVTTIHIEYQLAGDATFVSAGDFGTDRTSIKITGLENGSTYNVVASAEDAAGNVGPVSAAKSGIPVHTTGFFDRYKQAGGEEQGGCTTGTGGPLAGMGAVLLTGFFFARRRRG